MRYKFKISLNGKHLFSNFSSDEHPIPDDETAKEVYKILKEVLTESKGYEISVIRWETGGTPLNFGKSSE